MKNESTWLHEFVKAGTAPRKVKSPAQVMALTAQLDHFFETIRPLGFSPEVQAMVNDIKTDAVRLAARATPEMTEAVLSFKNQPVEVQRCIVATVVVEHMGITGLREQVNAAIPMLLGTDSLYEKLRAAGA
jgi:hypothetical protein